MNTDLQIKKNNIRKIYDIIVEFILRYVVSPIFVIIYFFYFVFNKIFVDVFKYIYKKYLIPSIATIIIFVLYFLFIK